jgi:hypothetical protein
MKCARRQSNWWDIAIEAHMQKFGVDRKTAEYWIHGAMGG